MSAASIAAEVEGVGSQPVSAQRFKIFIRHIHNYTEYNQECNVSQVRSMDSAII